MLVQTQLNPAEEDTLRSWKYHSVEILISQKDRITVSDALMHL